MTVKYDIEKARGNWEVKISFGDRYGYFEYVGDNEDRYVSGGLWFRAGHDLSYLELTDYDGVFELPKAVVELLLDAGVDCSYLNDDAA